MSPTGRELLSVGIDVGTTTTQVVFSRLQVQDVARLGQVPRLQVNAKAVLYQSPIAFTPLLTPAEVDVTALTALVREEYRRAGVAPEQVETGAVIITGEIARASNADAILKALSQLAGDFVVTIAGPNVEAQIAARGAGAAAYSAEHYAQVTNVDIGGGTSNAAIFRNGEHRSSSALAVGGRQVVVEKTSGIVRHLAPPGRIIAEALNLPLREGQRTDLGTLERFCTCMAELIAELVEGELSELGQRLQLTPPLQGAGQSTVLFFSGGVGTYYYDPLEIQNLADVLVHHDVGPLLAQCLRLHPRLRKRNVQRPAETLRATVMGAASQTITLSGSTIWVAREELPLRNLPVVRPQLSVEALFRPERLTAALQYAGQRWDVGEDQHLALALDLPARLKHEELTAIVRGLVDYAAARPGGLQGRPLILILERDYAQVLGQGLHALQPDLPLIVVDQIGLGEGDFIDIGLPLMGGRVVPVSVKTLIFYH
ncbi:MAG TPA: ethanolamine ammonia-lyase reactivating factor EutA [Anaerolineae bacterium]|nr:ethanolamine ammonia-lyase reactivating factor EutA [Anaerolineae bacterium]HQM13034.1 ethanolamine ammonia-lyase reactivating factor EutA [Anaerolineae bacterium]